MLVCRDSGEARFLYVAPTGRIEREAMREGSRVSTFAFRYAAGAAAYPSAWTIRGAGGDAEVTLDDNVPATASEAASIDATFQQPAPFSGTSDGAVRVGGMTSWHAAFADVRVNGRVGRFQIDDGTTQLLVDERFARRAGIAMTFGHGIANTFDVGALHGRGIAVRTADLREYAADGILGLEFFLGHVVHVDYIRGSLDAIPHAAFTPPANARVLPMDVSEGMPLLAGAVGEVCVTRLVPDLGSPGVVFPRYLFDAHSGDARIRPNAGPYVTQGFLEGPILTNTALAKSLRFGPFAFADVSSYVEPPTPNDLEIPLDAIVGTRALRLFEWWFDYDASRVYVLRR